MKKLLIALLVAAALMGLELATAGNAGAAKPNTKEMVANQLDKLDTETDMLARLIYAEARGVKKTAERAAVVWCVLNRVDSPKFPNTIKKVVTQRHQFAYKKRAPVTPAFKALAEDVVRRWLYEKQGIKNAGRVLPKDYLWFTGHKGRNCFRRIYRSHKYWNWALPDPYAAGK